MAVYLIYIVSEALDHPRLVLSYYLKNIEKTLLWWRRNQTPARCVAGELDDHCAVGLHFWDDTVGTSQVPSRWEYKVTVKR